MSNFRKLAGIARGGGKSNNWGPAGRPVDGKSTPLAKVARSGEGKESMAGTATDGKVSKPTAPPVGKDNPPSASGSTKGVQDNIMPKAVPASTPTKGTMPKDNVPNPNPIPPTVTGKKI